MRIFSAISTVVLSFFVGLAAADVVPASPDVNSDGVVDTRDALIVSKCYEIGLASLPYCAIADLDGDGQITLSDIDIVESALGNAAPSADAGPNQAVTVADLVILDGGSSADPDGDALTFSWVLLSRPAGSAAALSDATAVTPTLLADVAGDYLIELVVYDGMLFSASDIVAVTVYEAGNNPPATDAGPDQIALVGDTVTLDGSASFDFDGDLLNFSWSLTTPPGSSASLSDPGAVNPTFTMDVAGTYAAQLIVNDGSVDSVPDTVGVRPSNPDVHGDGVIDSRDASIVGKCYEIGLAALPYCAIADLDGDGQITSSDVDIVESALGNAAPSADAGPDQAVTVADSVTLDGGNSADPDGDALAYSWVLVTRPSGSAAALSGAATANPTLVADLAGNYQVELVVYDGMLFSASDGMTVTSYEAGNNPPVADAGPDRTTFVGDKVTLDGSASSDYDGDPLSFSWSLKTPPGSSAGLSDPSAVSPTFTVDVAGTYVAQLIVNDGSVDSEADTVDVVPSSPDVNDDGVVDTRDVMIVRKCYEIGLASLPYCAIADLDGDGQVTLADIDIVESALGNAAPSADAGPDQAVTVSDLVTLNGGNSDDPDGDVLAYSWVLVTRPSGSAAALSDATADNPTLVADVAGDYQVELIVYDGMLFSAPDSVFVTASEAGNSAPVADAGPDQSAHVGDTVTLDGGGSSDADADPITFSWFLVSKPAGSVSTLGDPNTVNPSFVIDVAGDYVAELVVSDGLDDSLPDEVIVSTGNIAPVADAGLDQSAYVGDTVTLDGSGSSDVDGDPLSYAWGLTVPAGSSASLSDASAVMPTFDVDVTGTYVAQLIVNDGSVDSAPDTVSVSTDNTPPVADAGLDQSAYVGDTVTLDGSGSSDVDGDPLSYAWSLTVPVGSSVSLSDPGAVMPTFGVDAAGTYVAQLIVNDGSVDSAPDTVSVSTDNTPPVADAGPDQSAFVGDTLTLDGSGSSDVDGDSLTFNWSLTVPAGSSAVLSDASAVMPTFGVDAAGTYVAQLIVNDGTVDSAPDTVSVSTGNTPPVADAGPDQTAFVGDTATLDGSGSSDVDGDSLTFNWSLTVPAGSSAVLSDASAVMPTFGVDAAGTYVAQLIVNDGSVDSAPDTVSVSTDNTAPSADAGPDQTAFVGDTVTLDGSGSSDVDSDPLTFGWSLTAPAGSSASLSDAGAVMPTFVVDVTGTYVAQLIVNDGSVDSAPDTVNVSTDNTPPVADAGPDQTTSVGETVALDGSGSSDADGDPLDFFWSLSSIPPNSAAELSNPFLADPGIDVDLVGDYVVQLIVNDGSVDSAPDSVTISVPNQVPTADAGPDQSVDVGDTVALDGSGSSDPDGDTLSYSWSLTKPAGSGAALSSTTAQGPSFVADVAGAYSAELVVNDGTVDSAPDTVDVTATQTAVVSAEDDTASTDSDEWVDIDVLANDLPSGSVSVVPASLTQPANGYVSLNPDGTIRYEQAGLHDEPTGLGLYMSKCASCHWLSGFNGTDTFTYEATDGSTSDGAIVTVSVTTLDPPPGLQGDISGHTPTCTDFDNWSKHKSCALLGVTTADLAEISAFLQTGF